MDYLSNLRDVKSVIASVLRDHLSCVQGSSMKYTKFGDEVDSQENLNNDLLVDMFEGENLNCETFQVWSLSNDSGSTAESVSSVYGKGINSTCISTDSVCATSSDDSEHSSVSSSSEDEVPTRLEITYHFSFDTEEGIENVTDNECDSEQENVFEDGSFCSDNDVELLEYSSEKNGSKNNLLDASFGPNLGNGVDNVGLVDYYSDPASCDSMTDAAVDSDETPNVRLDNSEFESINLSDCDSENVSKYCGNPSTPSMRKGFIYYSSELRLYQGELCYDASCPEKKINFARKLFKKVFPKQKYVVNA